MFVVQRKSGRQLTTESAEYWRTDQQKVKFEVLGEVTRRSVSAAGSSESWADGGTNAELFRFRRMKKTVLSIYSLTDRHLELSEIFLTHKPYVRLLLVKMRPNVDWLHSLTMNIRARPGRCITSFSLHAKAVYTLIVCMHCVCILLTSGCVTFNLSIAEVLTTLSCFMTYL